MMMKFATIALLASVLVGCGRKAPYSKDDSNQQPNNAVVRTLVEEPPKGMKSGQDQKEANEVLKFIETHYTGNPRPKLYCSGGDLSTHIHVYGVTQPAEQDRIVALMQAEAAEHNWKPIYVIFRDREHFVAQDNGWQKRDGEKGLFSTVIKKP